MSEVAVRDLYKIALERLVDMSRQRYTLARALEGIERITDDPTQWDLWKIISQVHQDASAALAQARGSGERTG